jgi:Tfp pilus assembly protein PilP
MTMTTLRRFIVALALVAPASAAFSQTPAPAPKAPAATPAPATPSGPPAAPLPAPPPNYAYTVDGRRDPFVSLLNRGVEAKGGRGELVKRAEGVAGMQTSELAVRGIILSRGTWVAMVSGADNKVYTVRAGDRLADGVVRTVNAQSVVILQEVNDPLSLEKQREVRKFLRGGEEVK